MGLAVAMVVLALMAMLTGAFVTLNQSNFALLGRSSEMSRAQLAACSGLQYARMRLESNVAWGRMTPTGDPPFAGGAPVVDMPGRMITYEDGYSAVGIMPESKAHFQVYFQPDPSHTGLPAHGRFTDGSIAANPGDPGSWSREWSPGQESRSLLNSPPTDPPLPPTADLRGCYPRNCNLIITGYASGTLAQLDVTLGNIQVVDAPLMSEGTMAVELSSPSSGQFNILSLDPSVKAKLRSRADLLAPGSSQILFGDGSQPNAGSAVSSTNVLLNTGISVSTDANGGVTSVGSLGSPIVIGDGVNDASEASAAEAAIKGSVLPNSNQAEVPDLTADQLKAPPSAPLSMNGGLYHFVDDHTVNYWSDPAHDPVADPTGFSQTYTDEIRDGSGNLLARLAQGRLIIPNGANVETSGPTRVSGDLAVGYDPNTLTLPSGADARLKVQGTLEVKGETVGGGTVVAQASGADVGALKLTGKSAMSASPDSGIALYADGPISITGVKAPEVQVLPMDFAIFRDAVHGLPNSWDEFSGWYPQGVREWINWDDSNPSDNPKYWAAGADDHTLGEPKLRDSVLSNFDTIYLPKLLNQFPVGINDPNVKAQMDSMINDYNSSGGVSLGRYIRIREFLRESQADSSPGAVAASYTHWSDLHDQVIKDEVNALITSQMDHYAQQAAPGLLDAYLEGPNPQDDSVNPNDVEFKGLVYTRTSFLVNPNGNRFLSQGSVISRGPLVIKNARDVTSTYNPLYLNSMVTYTGGAGKVEQRFWSLR